LNATRLVLLASVAGLIICGGFCIQVSQTQAASNLSAGYAFDEGSGTTASDASGNNITGTLTNGATWGPGRYGTAVNLDGVSDYVNLGNPSALQITGSITISAWINARSFPPDDGVIVSKRSSSLTGYQLDTTIDEGPRSIGFKLTNTSGEKMMRYGRTALQTNTWYHVTGVYNAAAHTMDVYLNGELDNGTLIGTVSGAQINSGQAVVIGRRSGNTGYEFAGSIDEVRIYARALTQAEIQADMSKPIGQ
jgi:Concanavalin A-like lectin/glucanases superfamily